MVRLTVHTPVFPDEGRICAEWRVPLTLTVGRYGVILNSPYMSKRNRGIRRKLIGYHRRMRELAMIAKGVLSTDHPVMAHIIPMRRCNLSCTYCNEYDDFSKPVPLETMKQRIDHL